MRLCLPQSFLLCDLGGLGFINVVHRDELFDQQRLQALQIVAGIRPFRLRAIDALFGRHYFGLGAADVGFSHRHRTLECSDSTGFIGDLTFEGRLFRKRSFERVLVRPVVDFKQQFALFYELVVVDGESDQRAFDLWGNSDVVRQNGGIIGPRMVGRLAEHNQADHGRGCNNAKADPAPDALARMGLNIPFRRSRRNQAGENSLFAGTEVRVLA